MTKNSTETLSAPPRRDGSRRDDIDGLRAVALGAVVLYHAGFGAARGGFVGVDMFFVISGYFIALGLLRDRERGRFTLGDFYFRRFWRILPPAAGVCLLCVIPAYLWSTPPDFVQFGKTLLSVLTFVSNYFFYSQGGYFDAPLEMNPFLHTWFLSVQAQFYIVFPLIVWLVGRKFPKAILALVAGLLVASFVASELSVRYFPTAAYYLLSSRLWELMTGSLAAVLTHRGMFRSGRLSRGAGELLSWLSVALIAGCGLTYSPATPFPGVSALPVCLGTAALLVVPGMTPALPSVHALLSLRPFVWVGTISYSVYLCHWPIFVYAKEYLMVDALPRNARFAAILLAFALGAALWALLERGAGNMKGIPAALRAAALCLPAALAALFLATLSAGGGLPSRFPPEAQPYLAVLSERTVAYESPVGQVNAMTPESAEKIRRGDLLLLGDAEKAPVFLAWGDSHIYHYRALLEKLAQDNAAPCLFLPTPGHPPLAGVYRAQFDATQAQREGYAGIARAAVELVRERRIPVVLLSCYWWFYPNGDLTAPAPALTDNAADGNPQTGFAALAAGFRATVSALEEAGAAVWIIRPTPFYPVSVPHARIRGGGGAIRTTAAAHEEKNADVFAVLAAIARDYPSVRFIDPVPTLCPDGDCLTSADGRPLYFDEHHLSAFGALYLEPAFAALAASLRKHAK